MRSASGWLEKTRGSVRVWLGCALTALILVPAILWAGAPAWWTERGVLNPTATADDYAAVNQGQVKNIAKQAYEEIKSKLGSAGPTLDSIWANPATSTDDYAAINLGQLKNVAEPFYARLAELGYTGQPLATGQTRPWGGTADDYALANIGQVKNLFSFDPSLLKPDLPETLVVTKTSDTTTDLTWDVAATTSTIVQVSYDGGATWKTLTVLAAGVTQYSATDLNATTTSSFRVLKSVNGVIAPQTVDAMQANGFDPATHDLSVDTDGDGLSDAEEYNQGTDPTKTDTDGDGVSDADDSWPTVKWISSPRLPDVRYAVVRLHSLGWPDNRWASELDDQVGVLGTQLNSSGNGYALYYWRADMIETPTGTEVPLLPYQMSLSPGDLYTWWNSATFTLALRMLAPDGRVSAYTLKTIQESVAGTWKLGESGATSFDPQETLSGMTGMKRSTMANGSANGRTIISETGNEYNTTNSTLASAIYAANRIYTDAASSTALGQRLEHIEYYSDNGPPVVSNTGNGFIPLIINNDGVVGGYAITNDGLSTNVGAVDLGPVGPAALWDGGQITTFAGRALYLSDSTPCVFLGAENIDANDTDYSRVYWAHKQAGTWTKEDLLVWDSETHQRRYPSIWNPRINARLEMVSGSELIRNGTFVPTTSFTPAGWSDVFFHDINKNGVILAHATRTLDDQGVAIPVASQQFEQVLLMPYEVLTRDLSDEAGKPAHTEVVAASSPAPDVELHVESAEINASGNLSVVVSGKVSDHLSEVIADSSHRVAQLHFKVDGQSVGSPVTLTYAAVTDPLRLVNSATTFSQTLVIPNPKPRGYIIVAETDANAAGNTGWGKVAVGLDTEMITFSDSGSRISIGFNQAPANGTIDTATVYFGTRSPLAGDGTLTETGIGSGVYTGTIHVGTQTATCTLQIKQPATFDTGATESLPVKITYQEPGEAAVTATGIWKETGPTSLQFLPDGYSFAGQRLVVNQTSDLPGSQPSSFEPLIFRVGMPVAWAQASGFAFTVNGQSCTLKEFTYDGKTDTYVVTSAADTHPRIFVASTNTLPAEIAVANASAENDTINWMLTLGGNPAFTVQTQVVAGPDTLESELLSVYIESLPHWASTDSGAGVGASISSSSETPGWHRPGDTITNEDLRTAYAFLYPDSFSQLLLHVYDSEGHHIELGDVLGDYSFSEGWLHPSDGKNVIHIENDDDDMNPAIAAQYLWKGLNEAHATDYSYRTAVATAAGSGALLEEAFQTWHANVAKTAAQYGVAAGELYLSGIGIVNEPLNWVLAINDASEGHYTALACIIPFIPHALVASKPLKIISKTTGKVLDTIADATRLERLQEIYLAKSLTTAGTVFEQDGYLQTIRRVLTSPGGAVPVPTWRGQLAYRMEKLSARPSLLYQAHHDLPWQLRERFARSGIDVNDPAFGRWAKISDHKRWHNQMTPDFNQFWKNWFDLLNGIPPTKQQILDKLAEARSIYSVES